MPFIPHTSDDESAMLATLGISSIDELFTELNTKNLPTDLTKLPEGLSEMAVTRFIQEREPQFTLGRCFIGAGAYEHHIPAAVWQITGRGEFYTAYTPYQAEASQGSLQLIYEFQTMMCHLFAMEVANASLYDGATALAEAVLMAARIQRTHQRHKVLVPETLHPRYREVLATIVKTHEVEFISVPISALTGRIDQSAIPKNLSDVATLIIPQPNFFGVLEDVTTLTRLVQQQGVLVIAVVNPLAMALLTPPGEWSEQGVDIVCGEGQPLGIPLSSGGPYFGFMCSRKKHVRQLPGRIVGRTTDAQGRSGYTLTLQAREQHIRRSKANSNICTNQGLMVVAASIYLSLLGPRGLSRTMLASCQRACTLRKLLTVISGVTVAFTAPHLHEFVLRLPCNVKEVVAKLAEQGLQAGYALGKDYPQLDDCLLVCATETKTYEDLVYYQQQLLQVLTTTNEI